MKGLVITGSPEPDAKKKNADQVKETAKSRPRSLGWLLSPRSSSRSQATSSSTDVAVPVSPRALAKPPAKGNEAASGEAHHLPTVELSPCDSDGCSSDVGAGADRHAAAASDQSEPGSPALSSADLSRANSIGDDRRSSNGSAYEYSSVPPSPTLRHGSREFVSGHALDDLLATFDLGEDDLKEAAMQDYTVGRTLGRGRYGKVKQAIHKLSREKVALKIIGRKALDDNKEIANEVRALRELRHRNVMSMYDVISTPNALVLVLEILSGGELFDYIVVRTKLSEKEGRKFLRQILLGLRYCHARGIVHRDLKLENMLLDDNGNVKIGDFGFSNIFRADSLMSTFVGSAAYAAPEILANEHYVGPATDVWSLGVIMYTLLTGKQPFDQSGNQATFFQKVQLAEFDMPEFVSVEAQDMIRSILKRNPAERPTIAELCKHPWILIGDDFPEAHQEETGESPSDALVLEEIDQSITAVLTENGLPIADLMQDLAAGNLTRSTAAYKLMVMGRAHEALSKVQDEEISAIANMLAARSSAANSPVLSRKRMPAGAQPQGRGLTEVGFDRRSMSIESGKVLRRSPKSSMKEIAVPELISSSAGTIRGLDTDQPGMLGAPQSSKSLRIKKTSKRTRANTVSTSGLYFNPGAAMELSGDESDAASRSEDEKKQQGRRSVVVGPQPPPAHFPSPTLTTPPKPTRSVAKEIEISKQKIVQGSPLASRKSADSQLNLTDAGGPVSPGLSPGRVSRESLATVKPSLQRLASSASAEGPVCTSIEHTSPARSRLSSTDIAFDGDEAPAPKSPVSPSRERPARHFFARGHSHDCAEDATRANSITSFASYDPSKSPMDGDGADSCKLDYASMPMLPSNRSNSTEHAQESSPLASSADALSTVGGSTADASSIRRKRSKMSHFREMLAWPSRESAPSSPTTPLDSPLSVRSAFFGSRRISGDDDAHIPAPASGHGRHTVFNAATTSSKAPHKIMDEITRVCKANKVKYVHEGNVLICVWKPGKKDLKQMQGELMHMDPDVTVRWEMEVHRLERLDMHGVRLRRTGGNIWFYKALCTRLMEQMKL